MTAEQLKASVLQMAIEGKLVPQLDDEPAVDIEAVEPEEVHFAIPEKWKWVTLEKLFNFVDYRGKTPIKSPSGVRLMTASNVRKGYIDHTRMEFISKEEFATRQSRGISAKGDILFTTEAPLGNAALADLEEYSAGQRVITLQSDTVNKQLYVYFLISPYFQKTLAENATGTTAQGIKAAKLKKLSLPLPPIAEQDRIVTLLNEILPLIEEYGKAHSALKNAEEALPAQLRASFLQEAIQGKLVPQLDDEPAVEIAGEEPEEVPFAIPEKWKWVKLEDICLYIQRGKSPKYSDIQQYPVVSQKCNQWDGFHIEKAKFIQPETIAKYEEKRILRDGDLLWNSTGTGTLGRVAEYQNRLNPYGWAVADSHVTVVRCDQDIVDPTYLYFYLRNPSVQRVIEDQAEGSTNQKELSLKTIKAYPIPLPPLAEQRRIVARLEELLPHVDAIAGLR